ncbi:MAG: hypothetical protein ACOY0T_37400 [Myxococcota bacterium]
MTLQHVNPVRCVYSREQVCQAYWDACSELGLPPTVSLVKVLVAHGALESGNFKIGLWNNNPGNIKLGARTSGPYTCITLNEVLKDKATGRFVERWFSPEGELSASPNNGGKLLRAPLPVPPGHPQTRMRAYPTLSEGISDKLRFLLHPGWAVALEFAARGSASGYVRSIRSRGYFTAFAGEPDPTPYEMSVVKLAAAYEPIVEAVASRHEPVAFEPPVFEEARDAQRLNLIDPELRARIETTVTILLDDALQGVREDMRGPDWRR